MSAIDRVVTVSDGIKPGSRITVSFDVEDAEDMRALRVLTERAVEDTEAVVARRVGLIRGAENLDPSWVRMIARHGARLALGAERNPDREGVTA